jgi:hypothetical protein
MQSFNFHHIFEVISIQKLQEFIESPMDFSGIEKELIKYEKEGSADLVKDFDAKAQFISNRDAFNRRDSKFLKKNEKEVFILDLKKIIFLKSKHINNAPELITIDVINKSFFDFVFIKDNEFNISITSLGLSLIHDNLSEVTAIIKDYNIEISNFY